MCCHRLVAVGLGRRMRRIAGCFGTWPSPTDSLAFAGACAHGRSRDLYLAKRPGYKSSTRGGGGGGMASIHAEMPVVVACLFLTSPTTIPRTPNTQSWNSAGAIVNVTGAPDDDWDSPSASCMQPSPKPTGVTEEARTRQRGTQGDAHITAPNKAKAKRKLA